MNLSEVMNGSMYKEYNKKRALFEKYLQYRNKKVNIIDVCSIRVLYVYITQGYVFLDTADVREYDELQLASTLKVYVSTNAIQFL